MISCSFPRFANRSSAALPVGSCVSRTTGTNMGKGDKDACLINTEGHSFKTLRFFQVIRLCSHRLTFMLMTWKISSIFSTVISRISDRPLLRSLQLEPEERDWSARGCESP